MSPWSLTIMLVIFVVDQTSSHQIMHHHKHRRPSYLETEHCYANEQNPYLYFASKTAYNAVYKPNSRDIIPDECVPEQLWMLVRHGTRYPLLRKMKGFLELGKLRDEIVMNHENQHGELCEEDLKNLRNWRMKNVSLLESDHLTQEGFQDLWDIGNRTRARFQNLFNKPYSADNYKVQYTKHSKTKHSAEAFALGLFHTEAINIPEPKDDDLLPQIYPNCKVAPIPDADDPEHGGKMERALFKEGELVAKVVHKVNRRLGFVDHKLTIDEIEQVYDICRYEKSWNFNKLNPWCAVFTADELQIMEYIGDLSYYYNSGHGYSANLRTGCPLVRDMMETFRDVANHEHKGAKAVFYFGHSTTMYNLFARLGLAKDAERITHDNYYEMLPNRQWHTSLLAPFSANFAAVFLRCNSGTKDRVAFYHNEAPFLLPGCNSYACDWTTIDNKYKSITDPTVCNFDLCTKNGTVATSIKTEHKGANSHASITAIDASHSAHIHSRLLQGSIEITSNEDNQRPTPKGRSNFEQSRSRKRNLANLLYITLSVLNLTGK
ncbi:multiple inositol polyphosphate phosphatase 1 isoform X2 [Nilaparvata lugens]|uniref:multiple inositol polyphosphate phosphatase 1 isoform X2 n=1 Tax=Nilaparvata lugens TaxID=108931 RepID=UPI000B98E4C2|nr:multiple inositol polyphosphate phosphatase 1 isoform X2 [Nilaparvata lugens]